MHKLQELAAKRAVQAAERELAKAMEELAAAEEGTTARRQRGATATAGAEDGHRRNKSRAGRARCLPFLCA